MQTAIEVELTVKNKKKITKKKQTFRSIFLVTSVTAWHRMKFKDTSKVVFGAPCVVELVYPYSVSAWKRFVI